MPLEPSLVPSLRSPAHVTPPVVVVGLVPYGGLMEAQNPVQFHTVVLSSTFYPIGFLEVGATFKVITHEAPLPVFEGETQHSNLTFTYSGKAVHLTVRINVFSPTFGFVENVSSLRGWGAPLGNHFFSGVGYNALALATKWEALGRDIPVAGIIAISPMPGGIPVAEYLLIINARASLMQSAPIGGTPPTAVYDFYSYGLGALFQNMPKIGVSQGAAPNMRFLTTGEAEVFSNVFGIAPPPTNVGIYMLGARVHDFFGTPFVSDTNTMRRYNLIAIAGISGGSVPLLQGYSSTIFKYVSAA